MNIESQIAPSEFECLMSDLFDGTLDEVRRASIRSVLRDNIEARNAYCHLMALHVFLHVEAAHWPEDDAGSITTQTAMATVPCCQICNDSFDENIDLPTEVRPSMEDETNLAPDGEM